MLLSLDQKLNLVDLYSEEIEARLLKNWNKLGDLEALVSGDRLQEILNRHSGDAMIGVELWTEFRRSALNNTLYERLLIFLKEVDIDLHAMINVTGYCQTFLSGFYKTLSRCPELTAAMGCISVILEELSQISGMDELIAPLRSRFDERTLSEDRVKKILLRYIPLATIYGYEHLLRAIYDSGECGRDCVLNINPHFLREYDYITQFCHDTQGAFCVIEEDDNVAEKVAEALGGRNAPKNLFRSTLNPMPAGHRRSLIVDMSLEKPIKLRQYQEELVRDGCQGRNVLICAPTGSGKTIVGTHIIRDHIYRGYAQKKRRKVCFVVPTTSLVEQQHLILHTHLKHCAKVSSVYGNNPANVSNRGVIDSADVIVATPQIIVNLLTEQPMRRIEESGFVPFLLSNFTLIVFDETHHSVEDNPYNAILRIHHDMKYKTTSDSEIPQIVGMTASIGSGRAANVDQAVDHTIKMCANMDIHIISRVRANRDELDAYTSNAKDEVKFVVSKWLSSPFYVILESVLLKFEQQLLQVPEADHNISVKTWLTFVGTNRNGPAYDAWITALPLKAANENDLSRDSRVRINHCAHQLKIFYVAVQLFKLFGSMYAIDHIEKQNATFFRDSGHDDCRYLEETLKSLREKQDDDRRSDLFAKLLEELDNLFATEENSRILIFLLRRDYCELLSRAINAIKSGDMADYLTGQASPDDNGTTLNDMKRKLAKFKRGETKILCVTTVAQEGIDILECNLVIEYNNVSNDIGRIQRRGRGRAKNARSMLLTLDEDVEKRALANEKSEELMMSALDMIDRYPPWWFREQVDKRIKQHREERLRQQALNEERRVALQKARYAINCRKCNTFLVESKNIATFASNFCVVDTTFWDRVVALPLPPDTDDKLLTMPTPHMGKLACRGETEFGKCATLLGRIVIVNGVRIPTVQCRGLVFVKKTPVAVDETRHTPSQWRVVLERYFQPVPISDLNLREMQTVSNLTTLNKIYDENYKPMHALALRRDQAKMDQRQQRLDAADADVPVVREDDDMI